MEKGREVGWGWEVVFASLSNYLRQRESELRLCHIYMVGYIWTTYIGIEEMNN